jgi:hypothetical protein
MLPHDVIVLTPALDDDFCFGARAEPFEAEAFVAELTVEALGDAILSGLAGHRRYWFAIRLADNRHHLLFREPTLPHCSLRIGSQSLN